MEPMTPADVQARLDQLGFGTQIIFFESTTATSQQAADNIGCALGQIVKSICFLVKDHPVVVLTSGAERVDDRKIAALYGVGRKHVSAARGDDLVEIFGYPAGSVPPFPHRSPHIDVYIDRTLTRWEQLYAAGGAHNAIFPITLEQLQAATGAALSDVVKDAQSD
ncbi:MAG: YbaK/EbsC family protein [Anaerolineae bacterium]|nr:YbaK/EbsC family protein [Anaerolineae bacterium]